MEHMVRPLIGTPSINFKSINKMNTEKLYLAKSGKEVKYGEEIDSTFEANGTNFRVAAILDSYTIPILKEMGILATTPPQSTDPTISMVIERLSNKLEWHPKKVERYLDNLINIMPMAAFNIVLREIAMILDKKYPDHIEKSDKIYVVSTLDGRIHEVNKSHIKNYRNFAAFRSIEDAKIACNILRVPLKEMFKSGK